MGAIVEGVCNWLEDDAGVYDTTCGHLFVLIDGTPADNGMKYCCYCGRVLMEERRVVDDD